MALSVLSGPALSSGESEWKPPAVVTSSGALQCVMEVDSSTVEGSIAAGFVRDGIAADLSLGYTVDALARHVAWSILIFNKYTSTRLAVACVSGKL